jgi:hypothetical protein
MTNLQNNFIDWYNKTFNTTSYQNEVKRQEELVSQKAKDKWEHRMNVVIPEMARFYIDKDINLYNDQLDNLDAFKIPLIKENHSYTRKKIQHLVSIITKAYKDDPEKLRAYFNAQSDVTGGLTTAAYFNLTGNIQPCQGRYFGGLGAKVNDSATNLTIERSQFHYASIGEYAFENATISNFALFGSEILDKST